MMMIIVECNKRNTKIWHIWYVPRRDQKKIMIILSSCAIYYYRDRDSNKQTRIMYTRQICDRTVISLIVSKNNYKFSINQFFDHHQDQGQNNKLIHYKSTLTTFDDSRRHTQLEESMKIANTSTITLMQENIKENF